MSRRSAVSPSFNAAKNIQYFVYLSGLGIGRASNLIEGEKHEGILPVRDQRVLFNWWPHHCRRRAERTGSRFWENCGRLSLASAEQETGRLDGTNNRTSRRAWRNKKMGLEGLVGAFWTMISSREEARCLKAARELSSTIKAPRNRKWNTVSSKEE